MRWVIVFFLLFITSCGNNSLIDPDLLVSRDTDGYVIYNEEDYDFINVNITIVTGYVTSKYHLRDQKLPSREKSTFPTHLFYDNEGNQLSIHKPKYIEIELQTEDGVNGYWIGSFKGNQFHGEIEKLQ